MPEAAHYDVELESEGADGGADDKTARHRFRQERLSRGQALAEAVADLTDAAAARKERVPGGAGR